MSRQRVSSGTPWEDLVGYSRAMRVGNLIFVSGTTASDENGATIAQGDAYGQAKFILKKIEGVLIQAGAQISQVVRTRIYVTDIDRWEEIGKAHAEVFRDIRPGNTLVEVTRLEIPDHLVEIEVDAVME
ncbi:MAG: RidA family protein [Planctomycetaceae bacterium]|nr:RidA family protein [Planctomycetaceae bacterium]